MKTNLLKKIFGAAVLPVTLAAVCLPENSGAQTSPDNAAQPAAPDTLPADVAPSSPLAEVIKLAQAGVSENVILSYINNSGGAFALTSDQIIYLKDLGLPDEAVTAMIQRDKQLGATATPPTPPPTATTDTTATAPEQPAVVTQNYFYDTLSPYGSWVNVDGYGLCWQPTTVIYDSAWQPYCDHGHWVYTDDGWFWVSDYSWGACAFHYGRWFHDDRRGWCWWPDTAWAPSWVTWRYADDYCGWAPLPPRTVYREGVGIVYNGATIGANFDFGIGVNFFTFVPTRNFCDPHPERFRVPHDRAQTIYQHTIVVNNFVGNNHDHTVINNGIAPDRIAAVAHVPVPHMTLRETTASDRRGEHITRDTIIVNRPQFKNDPAATLHQDAMPRPVSENHPSPRSTTINDRNNRNNFAPAQQTTPPPQNNFTAPQHNSSAPQTQPTTPVPHDQNRNGSPADFSHRQIQTTPQTPSAAPGAPVQTPSPNGNSHQSDLRPRQQIDQPGAPRTFMQNPDSHQKIDAPAQNQLGAPPASHFAAPTTEQSQRNLTPRQSAPSSGDSRSVPNEPTMSPPQTPAVQNPPPAQRNPGRRDNNQNGQQQ